MTNRNGALGRITGDEAEDEAGGDRESYRYGLCVSVKCEQSQAGTQNYQEAVQIQITGNQLYWSIQNELPGAGKGDQSKQMHVSLKSEVVVDSNR